jgi:uncharacterized protein (UPF0261 family)
MIDVPGKPFHDPEADAALFAAIRESFAAAPERRLVELPCAINDPAFADSLAGALLEILPD